MRSWPPAAAKVAAADPGYYCASSGNRCRRKSFTKTTGRPEGRPVHSPKESSDEDRILVPRTEGRTMMVEVDFMDLLEALAPAHLVCEYEKNCENPQHRERTREVLAPALARLRRGMAEQAAKAPLLEQMALLMEMDARMAAPGEYHGPEGGAAHNPADPRGDSPAD